MTEEDYARYIRELKNINTILRLVADGQLPLHECWVRIAASRDRMQGRAAQHSHQDETGNAKRHAMTAGPSSPVSARVSLDPGLAHSSSTSAKITFELEVPADLARLHLPKGVNLRLQALLHKQDAGTPLGPDEQAEAEGLVDLADLLLLLRMRASEHSDIGVSAAGPTGSPRAS